MKLYRSILTRMFLSYLCIFVIALTSTGAAYILARNSIFENTRQQVEVTLTTLSESVDIWLEEIEHVLEYVEKDDLVEVNLIPAKQSGKGALEIYQLANNLYHYPDTTAALKELSVILHDRGYVVTPGTAIPYQPRYSRISFPWADQSFEEMDEWFFTGKFVNQVAVCPRSGSDAAAVLIMRSLFTEYSAEPLGFAVAQVDALFLQNTLKQVSQQQNTLSVVLDSQGNLIASYAGAAFSPSVPDTLMLLQQSPVNTVNVENHLVVSAVSDKTGWVFINVIPRANLEVCLIPIQRMLLLILFVVLMMGVSASWLISRKRSKSLSAVISSLDVCYPAEFTGRQDEYQFLNKSVQRLINDNHSLADAVEQQKVLLRSVSLRRLMEGRSYYEEDAAELEVLLQRRPYYLASIIQVRKSDIVLEGRFIQDAGLTRVCMKEVLGQYFSKNSYSFDLDDKRLLLLLFFETWGEGSATAVAKTISKILSSLKKSYNIEAAVSVGEIHTQASALQDAYREICFLDRFLQTQPEKQILFSKDLPNTMDICYYPLEIELQLITHLKRGNREGVSGILDTLYQENFCKCCLSDEMIRQMLSSVKNSILRRLDDLPGKGENLLEQLCLTGDFAAMSQCIMQLASQFAENQQEELSQRKVQLKEKIEAYLHTHYGNSGLTIRSLGESIGLSESAVYQFFRECMDDTFADMLERIRIDAACALLRKTDYAIKTIAFQTGYNSDTSFRRAFKRTIGMTPGEYAESWQKEKTPKETPP